MFYTKAIRSVFRLMYTILKDFLKLHVHNIYLLYTIIYVLIQYTLTHYYLQIVVMGYIQ